MPLRRHFLYLIQLYLCRRNFSQTFHVSKRFSFRFSHFKYSHCITKNDSNETEPFLLSYRELVNFFEKQYRETFERRVRPGTNDYLAVIHSSTSFTFANAETIFMDSAILLHTKDDAVRKTLQTRDDHYLNTVFFSLMGKCDGYKTHISSASNFLTEYFNYLSD